MVSKEFRRPLAVAILLNLGLLSALIWAGLQEPPKNLLGQKEVVTQVTFVSPPPPEEVKEPVREKSPPPEPKAKEPEPVPKQPVVEPDPPKPKEIIKPKEEKKPEPTPKPRKIKPKEVKPAPTPVPKKPEPTPAPPKPKATPKPKDPPEPKPSANALSPDRSKQLYDRYRPKKPSPSRMPDKASPPAAKRPSSPIAAPSKVTVGKSAMKGLGLPDYYARTALAKVGRFFDVPDSERRNAEAVVEFTIVRSGQLTGIRVRRSSGNSKLDQYAIAAIKAANPFAPLPDSVLESRVTAEITFSFEK